MPLRKLFFFLSILFFFSCGESTKQQEKADFSTLEGIVGNLESELSLLNKEIVSLKTHHEFLLENRDSILQFASLDAYKFVDGYSANMPGDNPALSSIVIFDKTPDYSEALTEVKLTNSLDSMFGKIQNKYDFVAQVYSNSTSQISRVYPAFDAKSLITKDIDLTSYNFFYEGNLANNPSKSFVWIPDAYVDPAGRGWILSLIQPVYDGEKLFSVLGIDITVDQIIDRYLDSADENLIIVTKDGDIVAASSLAIEALSFPPLRNHVYKEIVLEDNFRISDYNLFNSKNSEVRLMADYFLMKNQSEFSFTKEYSPESARMVNFNLIDWVLIEVNLKGR